MGVSALVVGKSRWSLSVMRWVRDSYWLIHRDPNRFKLGHVGIGTSLTVLS
jgi:hypothetical protein